MAKVLVVGCGDLGAEIIWLLVLAGHEVSGVRASNKPLPDGVPHIQADVRDASTLGDIKHLLPNIVIYCISANAQTDESYKAHYVDGLNNILLSQVDNTQLQHVFFISSTRVYGQSVNQILNENNPALPNDFGGIRLLEAEALLQHLSCGATALRLSGIYGPDRLYLINMAKDPDRWPVNDRWTNRIHRDDAARFIVFLCNKAVIGESIDSHYIVTDDKPVLLYEVLEWILNKFNKTLPATNKSNTIDGKRLSNQRMRELNFELHYPDYTMGYDEIIKGLQNKND
jgi:nucleoside-diphosphate-sugar epimerase